MGAAIYPFRQRAATKRAHRGVELAGWRYGWRVDTSPSALERSVAELEREVRQLSEALQFFQSVSAS